MHFETDSKKIKFNPFKPSVPFLGHRLTVQTDQTQNAASD